MFNRALVRALQKRGREKEVKTGIKYSIGRLSGRCRKEVGKKRLKQG